ncbi:hypothetical protein [Phytomonospora endophytica]|uniref:Uncharacterized protein n=1 Tax=Phytomonospora endophytica TaxID=714109 RepID=A0A841FC31_9ACTN|nr:hypothetical protein [Phytomonospora endophytica]MBB6033344.1 hypothetical protein [Phytomonospora endophytica]GIG71509.1 hypothetical protein Pen01_78040 [Phytomonospora endophytica]
MTKDIKELLDTTAGHESLPAFDADAALKRGHGALSRRRLAVGGLTTGVVAIVAAAMVALPGIMAPAKGGDPSDPGPGTNAATPREALPELDPDLYYTWLDEVFWDDQGNITENTPEKTESSAKYTGAFYELLDQEFGGYTGDTMDFGRMDLKLVATPEALRDTSGAYEVAEEQVFYRLHLNFVAHQTDDGLVQWGNGNGGFEALYIDVRAPGDFTDGLEGPGPGSAKGGAGVFDLLGCEDRTDGAQAGQTVEVDVECIEKATAKNERYIEVTEVSQPGTEHAITTRKLVLYRVDGSAVTVRDTGDSGQDLSLGFTDLLAMAQALPLEPVL